MTQVPETDGLEESLQHVNMTTLEKLGSSQL